MLLQLGEHRIDTSERAAIMAILNVSRDSPIAASVVDPSKALARARELREQGAAIIDVGRALDVLEGPRRSRRRRRSSASRR